MDGQRHRWLFGGAGRRPTPAGTWGVAGVTDGGRIQQGPVQPAGVQFLPRHQTAVRGLGVGLLAWFEPLEL